MVLHPLACLLVIPGLTNGFAKGRDFGCEAADGDWGDLGSSAKGWVHEDTVRVSDVKLLHDGTRNGGRMRSWAFGDWLFLVGRDGI